MTTNTLILTLPCSIPSFYLAYRLYKTDFLGQIFNKQFAITLIISGKICVVIIILTVFIFISPEGTVSSHALALSLDGVLRDERTLGKSALRFHQRNINITTAIFRSIPYQPNEVS